jgi:hypothetical protein
MHSRFLVISLFCALALGLAGCRESGAARPAPGGAPAATVRAPVRAAGPAANDCLDCHGPFSKLIEATSSYVAPSGEKTSPHRYVPHDSKLAKDIPDCTQCHARHPVDSVPAKGSIDLTKVNVQWCYATCHHEKTLKSCKECHP